MTSTFFRLFTSGILGTTTPALHDLCFLALDAQLEFCIEAPISLNSPLLRPAVEKLSLSRDEIESVDLLSLLEFLVALAFSSSQHLLIDSSVLQNAALQHL